MFNVTRVTLYRWIEQGKIPEPMRDPETDWHIWQQAELDVVARLVGTMRKTRRSKGLKGQPE